MNNKYNFLLNTEPTDAQLKFIMLEVAKEAKIKAENTKIKLYLDLQQLVKRVLNEQERND